MKTLRIITGRSLRGRIRNEQIREKGVKMSCDGGNKENGSWYQHINMMDEDLVNIALKGRPEERVPPGRSPMRWHESWKF